jgi:hypothetical protein
MTQLDLRAIDDTEPCLGESMNSSPNAVEFSSVDVVNEEWLLDFDEEEFPKSWSNSTYKDSEP